MGSCGHYRWIKKPDLVPLDTNTWRGMGAQRGQAHGLSLCSISCSCQTGDWAESYSQHKCTRWGPREPRIAALTLANTRAWRERTGPPPARRVSKSSRLWGEGLWTWGLYQYNCINQLTAQQSMVCCWFWCFLFLFF